MRLWCLCHNECNNCAATSDDDEHDDEARDDDADANTGVHDDGDENDDHAVGNEMTMADDCRLNAG